MQRASERANAQNFICSHLPWAYRAEGGQSEPEMLEESLGLVTLGRELEEQPAEAIVLRQTTSLQVASA